MEAPRPAIACTDCRPDLNAPEVTVILPVYEEAEAIRGGKLAQVVDWARSQVPPAEVLVVDDGSRDATSELAWAYPVRLSRIPHGGKAAAVAAGVREARGRWVLVTDMDLATPIGEASGLLAALRKGADIALGTRGLRRSGAPLGRLLLSLGHTALRRMVVGLPWTDTQCGFKAFGREAALGVLEGLRRYPPGGRPAPAGPCVSSGFDVEFLLVAARMGLRIEEVPVIWRYQETRRVARFRDALRGAADLWAVALHRFRGHYPRRRGPGVR